MISDGALIRELKAIAGAGHVSVGTLAKRRHLLGFRQPEGLSDAVAVVRPGSLVDLWRVARATVRARRVIIMQAANTSLTGGATPCGEYDRGVVVINTMRLKGIHLVNGGAQVVCLPGATLAELDRDLRPLSREPHSDIASTWLDATVVGGVCNTSGGALVRRGPAYTEAAIYAKVDELGELRLINELGIDLGREPEKQLENLERGDFARVLNDMHERACSAPRHLERLRDIEAATPVRFNADPKYLKGASGSAGRVIVFAVRLDTFPRSMRPRHFHVATNDAGILSEIRRQMLANAALTPIAAEYMHQTLFQIAAKNGRDILLAGRSLGANRLPFLFRVKANLDCLLGWLGTGTGRFSDKLLQNLGKIAPVHLSEPLKRLGETYTHHLFLRVDAEQVAEVRAFLGKIIPPAKGGVHECSESQGRKLKLHRFAAGCAAVRFIALRGEKAGPLVELDVALRRNDKAWWYVVPDHLKHMVDQALIYGHFFSHVFHQDFILKKDADAAAFRRGMLAHYEARGAESPAERNVGHQYKAKPALAAFYRKLDPTNTLNPGIGKTSRSKNWQ